MNPTDSCFVVSGCSGSGKSTLIATLAEGGERVVPEPGRQIVQEQLQTGGDGLPWTNPQRFVELCTERAVREYDRHAPLPGRTFFDRSLIDIATAVEQLGLTLPSALASALPSKRYAPLVFLSEPWQALFRTDSERRHDFAQAVAEYEALVPAYRKFGYETVFIPQASVLERAAFVLSTLSSREPGAA